MKEKTRLIWIIALGLAAALLLAACQPNRSDWSEADKSTLKALWIGSLKPLPPDPSNRYADDANAARLGQKIFFDTRFSLNGKVACATCHQPQKQFQDGQPLATGIGTTTRRTMTLIGTAYSPWFFWDGRKDSQWAQATGPMENANEHGGNRTQYAHLIDQAYRSEYEAIFGPLPDLSHLPANAGPVQDQAAHSAWDAMQPAERTAVSRIYANMGKAIAAYERKLIPAPARYDQYVEAVLQNDLEKANQILNSDETAGLRLFIGKADCIKCHNGPLFTNNDFHNTGIPSVPSLPEDTGRAKGAQQVLVDEFNCLSPYSDAGQSDCANLRFLVADGEELVRQFKPPSLRNVALRPPYMHAGQFQTLQQVLAHYNQAPAAPSGHSELNPLHLTDQEIDQLIAFLKTLDSPVAASAEWLEAPRQ